MGGTLTEHISATPDLNLSACLEVGESLEGFIASALDVVVDFSLGSAVAENGPPLVSARLPYIIGATNVSRDTLKRIL